VLVVVSALIARQYVLLTAREPQSAQLERFEVLIMYPRESRIHKFNEKKIDYSNSFGMLTGLNQLYT
jgi:hypothetical protein